MHQLKKLSIVIVIDIRRIKSQNKSSENVCAGRLNKLRKELRRFVLTDWGARHADWKLPENYLESLNFLVRKHS